MGTCALASVWCGEEVECSVAPGRCCKDSSDDLSCQNDDDTCTLGPTRAEVYQCNDESDCALDLICCREAPTTADPALTETSCMPALECVSDPSVSRVQACSTDTECLAGTCLLEPEVVYPYGTCGT